MRKLHEMNCIYCKLTEISGVSIIDTNLCLEGGNKQWNWNHIVSICIYVYKIYKLMFNLAKNWKHLMKLLLVTPKHIEWLTNSQTSWTNEENVTYTIAKFHHFASTNLERKTFLFFVVNVSVILVGRNSNASNSFENKIRKRIQSNHWRTVFFFILSIFIRLFYMNTNILWAMKCALDDLCWYYIFDVDLNCYVDMFFVFFLCGILILANSHGAYWYWDDKKGGSENENRKIHITSIITNFNSTDTKTRHIHILQFQCMINRYWDKLSRQ